MYFAIPGTQVDGHSFIEKAIDRGAVAVVCERIESPRPGITYLRYPSASAALGHIASSFYEHPSESLLLVGVTGTNGKTTTATLLYNIHRLLGESTGLLSTIQNRIDDISVPATHTTGDALQIQSLLSRMVEHGCRLCFMEVTSHAVVQNRIARLTFRAGSSRILHQNTWTTIPTSTLFCREEGILRLAFCFRICNHKRRRSSGPCHS